MLTKYDEYPLHQISDTFAAVQSGYQHWNDGHYICFCDMDGEICVVSTVRLYQNDDVLDGFVCFRYDNKQYNIRLSRRLRPEIDTFAVGPLRFEVIEPMKTLRLVLENNDFDIALDVICETAVVPYEDPVVVVRTDGRLISERAVYEVVGRVEGQVAVGKRRYAASKDRWYFMRNHSWGFMPNRGGPRLYGAPLKVSSSRSGLRNWVLYVMPDHGGFYELLENPAGKRLSMRGEILFPSGSQPERVQIVDIKHDLKFYDGVRRLKGGTMTLTDEAGQERNYEIEDVGFVYCHGGGYFRGFNDGLGQGAYRGDYHVEGEVWDVSHPVNVIDAQKGRMRLADDWAQSFTRVKEGRKVGMASFECVVFGAYQPYGFGDIAPEITSRWATAMAATT